MMRLSHAILHHYIGDGSDVLKLSKSILLVNLLHNFLHLPLIIYTLFSLLFILIIKLIYFIPSINHSNILFFMIIDIHFFYWAVNITIPIIKKSFNSWKIGSLIICLPHKFIHYVWKIWNIIYYLYRC